MSDRDLGERHATPIDKLLDETFRLMAHDQLVRQTPGRVGRKPDRWLNQRLDRLRDRYGDDARTIATARPHLTPRALADMLLAGPPPSAAPGFDRKAGLSHIQALKARLQEKP